MRMYGLLQKSYFKKSRQTQLTDVGAFFREVLKRDRRLEHIRRTIQLECLQVRSDAGGDVVQSLVIDPAAMVEE